MITDLADKIPADELAGAYQWSGMAASTLGDFETALAHLHRAEELCGVSKNNGRLALVLEATAYVYYAQDQLEHALPFMKRSVDLSRTFSTAHNVASALNNVALVQFKLGQAQPALETFNEAIKLLREISLKDLGQALGNRAEILTYLGQFEAAEADFEEAISLFEAANTDDEGTMIEVHLLWGYEYCSPLGQWEAARQHFAQVQSLMATRPDEYLDVEQKARLLLGWGQVAIAEGEGETAVSLLSEAVSLMQERSLAWWLPVGFYFQGLLQKQLGNYEQAKVQFQDALEAIEHNGNPDYLPLVWWEIAQLERGETQQEAAWNCLKTAESQSRYLDRVHCYQLAGNLLVNSPDPHWQQLGAAYLAKLS